MALKLQSIAPEEHGDLGLMIYQGLDSGEIARLETGHINLSEGKIYIPSGRKSSSRTLKLQAAQILPLKTYIEEIQRAERNLNYLFQSKIKAI